MSIDLEPIFTAVRQAAELCQVVQERHMTRSEKAGHEPVTIADYGSQAIICRALGEAYPDDGVMAEENGDQFISLVEPEHKEIVRGLIEEILGMSVSEEDIVNWLDHGKNKETSRLWIIDPIDGTKGFLGKRHYVNAVGILQDRKPVAGVLSAPGYPGGPRLLYAQDGAAFIQPLDRSTPPVQIHVSDRSDPATIRAMESVEKSHVGHSRLARVRQIAGFSESLVEQADSQEKYGRLAAGDTDLYLRLPRKGSTRPHSIWDHAPGAALVEAAGGKVTDVDGSPLDFSVGRSLQNYGVIGTNGPIHDLVVESVQKALAEEEEE